MLGLSRENPPVIPRRGHTYKYWTEARAPAESDSMSERVLLYSHCGFDSINLFALFLFSWGAGKC